MKAIWMTALVLFLAQMALAETTEKDLFLCQSQVPSFEFFTIAQVTEVDGETTKTSYLLKTGLVGSERWNQVGEAALSTGTPLFQSEFSRTIVILPETPEPNPIPVPVPAPVPPPSQGYEEEVFVNISINPSGTGSISVDADLAPVDCQLPVQN